MGRFKFEKINMKIVAAVAAVIIIILTAIFIALNAGLFKGGKKGQTNTNSNSNISEGPIISEEAKERTKPVDELNSAEKKYIIEENFLAYLKNLNPEKLQEYMEQCINEGVCSLPIEEFLEYLEEDPEDEDPEAGKIKDCNGNITFVYTNGEFKVDMSGVSCKGPNTGDDDDDSNSSGSNIIDDTNSNSNVYTGDNEPPEEVKNRKKASTSLTGEEKNYIIAENVYIDLRGASGSAINRIREKCVNPEQCSFNSKTYNSYTSDEKLGYYITGCTGNVYVVYVPGFMTVSSKTSGALRVVSDDTNPKANQIRISDVMPHLNYNMVTLGSYVKVQKVKAYTSATSDTPGALRIVSDNVNPNSNQIRISSVNYRVSYVNVKEGDYVVLVNKVKNSNKKGYIIADSKSKDAYKVVSDSTKNLKENEIKISTVKNRVNVTAVEVGDYVVVRNIDGYVPSNSSTSGSLKVVADFKTPTKNQIKISDVRPYLDTTTIKVGNYVKEGSYIVNTSKLTCKRG